MRRASFIFNVALLLLLVAPAATGEQGEEEYIQRAKLALWRKGKECGVVNGDECTSSSDYEDALAATRFSPVWHLRGEPSERPRSPAPTLPVSHDACLCIGSSELAF